MTIYNNITMVQGDTHEEVYDFSFISSTPIVSMYCTCKKTYDDSDAIFQKSLGSGIESLGNNKYKVTFYPVDTAGLFGNYVYDIHVETNDEVITAVKGNLFIEARTTEGPEPPSEYEEDIYGTVLRYHYGIS